MRCSICKHGQTTAASVTVTLERDGVTVVFRNVPAQVCDTCGEQYVDEQTTGRLLAQATEAARAGVQVEVRTYAAA
jgi:YgiT-type zinc finger domain-containing protein